MRQRNNNGYTYSTLVASLVIQLVVLLVFSNPVVSISQPCGSLQCENGGKCMDLSITATSSSSLSNLQASVKPILQCLCPPGYGGVTCSYYHGKLCSEDEAGEAATCSNGSCIPNPLNSNVTECPCDIAYSISPLAGQMCESPETEYCLPVWSHQPSRQFFCTNGGRCFGGGSSSTTIQEESDTWGTVLSDTPFTCQCPPEFEGPHCERLITVQVPLSSSSQKNMSSTASWLRPFLLSFFLTLTVISIGLFVQWKYVGIHVTPNHGEQQPEEEPATTAKQTTKEYPPSNVQNGSNKSNQRKGIDFDEMIEIEEDTEGEFV